MIHSTNDPSDINKDYRADLSLCGDATLVIEALIEEVGRQRKTSNAAPLQALKDELARLKKALGIERCHVRHFWQQPHFDK